ncbi:MAG: copper chaperone PCu(A)C, partial [Acetobacteraceae bacterium]|nr:copper chaperone PCu(A)C [Acetobacteraceae bacterium]
IDVSKGWTPAVAEAGGDRPLYMTITSHADTPDSLLRARCPTAIADFTEKHATDRGEGGFSMREVKNFTIPAGATVALEPEGNHLMLLHLRAPLQEGQTFSCAVVFQKAGSIPVEIKVTPSGAKSPS